MKGSVIIQRTYRAPIATVWKAITDKDDMKQWYFDLPEFKPEVGFEFRFMGGKDPNHPYLHICKITEVIPGRKLTYSWRFDGYAGLSHVTFELTSLGDETRLTLTHDGIDSFPASNPDFDQSNFLEGWTHIASVSLKKFVDPDPAP